MSINDKQTRFMLCLGKLILYAQSQQIGVIGKELHRTKYQAEEHARTGAGILNSLHCKSLAIDIVLIAGGELRWDGAPYVRLGQYWETLDADACWGGHFTNRDVYHFSLQHKGVK